MDWEINRLRGMTNFSMLSRSAANESKLDTSADTVVTTAMVIEMFSVPLIALFGFCGNTLSAITFFRKSMRKSSCSVFLAVRSISDNGFLLALVLTWISSVFELELSHVRGVCQTILLLTYISGCVSVWLVVFVTIENFMRICHPLVLKNIGSKHPARIITTLLCVCAFGVYHFPLWVANSDCTHNQKYCEVTQVLVYTDTLLTLVIPSFVITGLMSAILCNIIQTLQRPRRLRSSPAANSRRTRPVVKITKMLLIVSTMCFVLNAPSHVMRIYILINSFMKGQRYISNTQITVQMICQLIYYLNFSVNIIIYMWFGRNFRKAFKILFCRANRHCSDECSSEAINTVPKVPSRRRYSVSVSFDAQENNCKYTSVKSI